MAGVLLRRRFRPRSRRRHVMMEQSWATVKGKDSGATWCVHASPWLDAHLCPHQPSLPSRPDSASQPSVPKGPENPALPSHQHQKGSVSPINNAEVNGIRSSVSVHSPASHRHRKPHLQASRGPARCGRPNEIVPLGQQEGAARHRGKGKRPEFKLFISLIAGQTITRRPGRGGRDV